MARSWNTSARARRACFRKWPNWAANWSRWARGRWAGASRPKPPLLFDWDNWWAVEYSSGPSVDLKYVPQVAAWHKALHTLGIPLEFVSPEADLSAYKLVIAPVLYMVKPGVAERLEAFTQGGGTFVTTFFSGLVDENDRVHLGGYPGPLRKMLGLWAEEIDVLSPSGEQSRWSSPSRSAPARHLRGPSALRPGASGRRAGAGGLRQRLLRGRAGADRQRLRRRAAPSTSPPGPTRRR